MLVKANKLSQSHNKNQQPKGMLFYKKRKKKANKNKSLEQPTIKKNSEISHFLQQKKLEY